jgi:hypothetical protein
MRSIPRHPLVKLNKATCVRIELLKLKFRTLRSIAPDQQCNIIYQLTYIPHFLLCTLFHLSTHPSAYPKLFAIVVFVYLFRFHFPFFDLFSHPHISFINSFL